MQTPNDENQTLPTPVEEAVNPTPVVEEVTKVVETKSNAQEDFPIFSLPKVLWESGNITLPLPSMKRAAAGGILNKLENHPKFAHQDGRDWGIAFYQGHEQAPLYDRFSEAAGDPSRAWRQGIDSERGRLMISQPKHQIPDGKKLTGQKAVLRIRELTGSGGLVQIPLWHSGFWVTLKTPTEGRLLELERQIAADKVELGRITGGACFSNTTVYIAKAVIDCALEHLFNSTLEDETNILEKISIHDAQALAWGLACSIWMGGFQYTRAVIDAELESTQVVKEHLNLTKLQWLDTTALTEWQIGHMSKRAGSTMSNDSIKRYQDDFVRGKERKVELVNGVSAILKVPNVAEHLNSGTRWVDGIVQMVDRAFSYDQADDARNKYILDQARATNLRQYSHWIGSIETEAGDLIDDVETLEMVLDELTASDDTRKLYFEAISKYIEDSSISIIATPTVSSTEDERFPRFPHLFPLDALQTFFTLLAQKNTLIRAR